MRITQSKIALFIILYSCFISTAAHADARRTQRYEGTLHIVKLDAVSLSHNEKNEPYRWTRVSFDTLVFGSGKGAAFQEVFLKLDSMVRAGELTAYYSYLLNEKIKGDEVVLLGRNMEMREAPKDPDNPARGRVVTPMYPPFPAKSVSRIVVTYENLNMSGIVIPRPVSLTVLWKTEKSLDDDPSLYSLGFIELLKTVPAAQMRIVDDYMSKSLDLKH